MMAEKAELAQSYMIQPRSALVNLLSIWSLPFTLDMNLIPLYQPVPRVTRGGGDKRDKKRKTKMSHAEENMTKRSQSHIAYDT